VRDASRRTYWPNSAEFRIPAALSTIAAARPGVVSQNRLLKLRQWAPTKVNKMNEKSGLSASFLSPDGNDIACSADATTLPVSQSPPSYPDPALVTNPVRRIAGRKVVTTAMLTSATCRWPIGDPVDPAFHYCGQSPRSDSPYCETHDRLSYQPATRRKS